MIKIICKDGSCEKNAGQGTWMWHSLHISWILSKIFKFPDFQADFDPIAKISTQVAVYHRKAHLWSSTLSQKKPFFFHLVWQI